ncbi:MAG: lipase family protein [Mycobacteriaceae bacterium]
MLKPQIKKRLITLAIIVTLSGYALPATAEPVASEATPQLFSDQEFYLPPAGFAHEPAGKLLRVDETKSYPPIPGFESTTGFTATRIMYRSSSRTQETNAVTGTLFIPASPWTGPGDRPLIAYGHPTAGIHDRCAPSLHFSHGDFTGTHSNYLDGITILPLLNRGYAVVATDYEGLGTPGAHTFVDLDSEGYALLDSLRAANQFIRNNGDTVGKLGLWGYSQGAQAVGGAIELQRSYAPELNISAAYAGSPPSDPFNSKLDGHPAEIMFTAYTLVGLKASYPSITERIDSVLTPYGQAVLNDFSEICLLDAIAKGSETSLKDIFKEGLSITEVINKYPDMSEKFVNMKMGYRAPNPKTSILLGIGTGDGLNTMEAVQNNADGWRKFGADVEIYTESLGIDHATSGLVQMPYAFDWLDSKLLAL